MRTLKTMSAAALMLATTAMVLMAAPTAAQAQALFRVGGGIFIPVGGNATVTSSRNQLDTGDAAVTTEEDFNDDSGIGVTVFGMLTPLPILDVGVAMHFIPSYAIADDSNNSFEIGRQTDLNLRLGSTIPLGVIDLAVHGEGGLTFIGIQDEEVPTACESVNLEVCQLFDRDGFEEDNNRVGFNAGVGAAVRYSVAPFIGLRGGLDFQFYSSQLFNGSNDLVSFDTDVAATRFRLTLGVDFSL